MQSPSRSTSGWADDRAALRAACEPGVLALSVLAEIVGEYEALHPHG